MTEFYHKLILFLQEQLPAVEKALKQEESLPEQIRLQRIRALMRELLDHAQFYSKGRRGS
jgi:hypothetical protein